MYRRIYALQSPVNAAYGTFVLWLGWYGFNPGSTLSMELGNNEWTGIVLMNTTIGAMVGASTACAYQFVRDSWSLEEIKVDMRIETMSTGILAGLVAVTGPCISPRILLI